MAITYQLINSVIVGASGASSIDFTSIPQTYTDLKLVVSHRTDRSAVLDGFYYYINGTPTNSSGYIAERYLLGTGSSVSSGTVSNDLQAGASTAASATSNTFSSTELYFPNYSKTDISKTIINNSVSENNATSSWCWMAADYYYYNTNAITSIKLQSGTAGVNLVQYSTAYLYGIKNA